MLDKFIYDKESMSIKDFMQGNYHYRIKRPVYTPMATAAAFAFVSIMKTQPASVVAFLVI